MKNKRLFCLMLSLILCTQFVYAYAQEPAGVSPQAQNGSHTIDGQTPILGSEQIVKNASSVLLYETKTETLMYAWNADQQLAPASLVKIMTALLVLEKGNLADAVTVTEDVLNSVDSDAVSADLLPDEVMTVENLLYCMLVSSANDAAAVLADHVSGSQTAFVNEMNSRAQQLGCTNTNFVNCHGLHDENQLITARDVGRILSEALKNETFRTMFGTVSYTVPATNKSEARKLETSNFLMNPSSMEIYFDERVTGGRTGISADGNQCIAATAEKDGLSLISVIMGAASEYEEDGNRVKSFGGFPETSDLLDRGFEGFHFGQIIYKDQAIKQYPVPNGTSDVVVCPNVSISSVLPRSTDAKALTYHFKENPGALNAPIEKGQPIGSVEIWNNGICIGQSDLFAMNNVQVKEVKEIPEGQKSDPHILPVIWAILGAVGGCFVLLLIIRMVNKHKWNAKRRKYSAGRRRSR